MEVDSHKKTKGSVCSPLVLTAQSALCLHKLRALQGGGTNPATYGGGPELLAAVKLRSALGARFGFDCPLHSPSTTCPWLNLPPASLHWPTRQMARRSRTWLPARALSRLLWPPLLRRCWVLSAMIRHAPSPLAMAMSSGPHELNQGCSGNLHPGYAGACWLCLCKSEREDYYLDIASLCFRCQSKHVELCVMLAVLLSTLPSHISL